ncbi:norsolorinic acid reductase [Xylariaceae sp. FL1651]|nr:norsolorinic acid reductase [Xylariaceae sp. FL1651]
MAFVPAPEPVGPLNRYRLLAPTASVRVSPLCLGAMNFGDAWRNFMGPCDRNTAEEIMDFYFDQVRNFIDTSNNYQFQDSEKWVGEWMRKRGNRDQIVLATKYTTNYMAGPTESHVMANYSGNGTKSMMISVDASLRKLQTHYIDILYVHWWDYTTSIPEVMQSLNQLVLSGKVLYLGVSDTPAWVVSQANEYARNHGLRQFCVYQGMWSAAVRDFERDIIPMCKSEGMGIVPFGVMGQGRFKTDDQRKEDSGRSIKPRSSDEKVSQVLGAIAGRKSVALMSVAIAYVMHKAPYVFPVVGGRKLDHLRGNIEALTIRLSDEDIQEIEAAVPFDLGFPHNLIWGEKVPNPLQNVRHHAMAGTLDFVSEPKV